MEDIKIIFLSSTSFIIQDRYDLYIDVIAKKYNIELWTLKKIYKNRDYRLSDSIKPDYCVESLADFERKINTIKNEKILFITNLSLSLLKKIYNVIKKYNFDIVQIKKGNILGYLRDKCDFDLSTKEIIKKQIKRFSLFKKIINYKNFGKSKFDYLVSEYNYLPYRADNFVKIHHVKYDEFLNAKKEESLIKKDYILFIDSNIPYHPDILNHQGNKSVDPNIYFNKLNKFFEYMEKKYNMDVIISAHPKSDYTHKTFNNRRIIKYKTPNLIENSQMVIAHGSTSVINAILANKPIIFLYYDEMLKKATRSWTKTTIQFSRELNTPLINLDNNIELEIDINYKNYKIFKDKYLLNKKKKDKANSDLILNFLKSYFVSSY